MHVKEDLMDTVPIEQDTQVIFLKIKNKKNL